MLKYKNLTIIGTSHIAIESVKEVELTIKDLNPGIIALELDNNRFYALTHKTRSLQLRDILSLGLSAWLFNLIGAYVEKKIGEYVGVSPGSEMKTAIALAKKQNIKIALVDQNIAITSRRLTSKLTWKEKFRFIKEILKAMIFRKTDIEKFDLRKVPPKKTIRKLMNKLRKDYPNVYLTLVKERNLVISKNLYNLMQNNKDSKIVAVVGAGHEEDIIKIIKRI